MKTITIAGTEYKLPGATNTKVQQQFLEWARAQLVGTATPLDLLKHKLEGYSAEVQAVLVKEALAQERTPLNWNAPDVQGLLGTPEGMSAYTRFLWTYYQPDLTAEKITELHEAALEEYGGEYLLSDAEIERRKKGK